MYLSCFTIFFNAVLLSQDLNFNAEYFYWSDAQVRRNVNSKCMTFFGTKIKKKKETTLALCIKCLLKTIISNIMLLNLYLSKISPLNDTVKIDYKTNSRSLYILLYKSIQPNETPFLFKHYFLFL